ncbi:MAG: MMPL family transporter [Rubripirellula sp.]|nr:MMPL family transporter [Rubripirellula sp.]
MARSLSATFIGIRWPLLLVGCVALLVAYPISRRLDFDRGIESMFDPLDPTVVSYRELQDTFGGNTVVMLVYQDLALTTSAGIQRNQAIGKDVEAIAGVRGVLSPAILNETVKKFSPRNLFAESLNKLSGNGSEKPAQLPALFRTEDPIAAGFDELFAGYTHSKDHRRAAVVAMLEPDHGPETIEAMRQIAAELPTRHSQQVSEPVLVGEPVLVHDGFGLIERDGAKLAVWTIGLLSIVVLVSLADARFVFFAALVIGWSVTITKAILVANGIQLSLVSTVLTAIVTVITVTAVLHLGVRFRLLRNRGHQRWHAAIRTWSLLLLPIFWTCATDAAGFAALGASGILPIRQFGIMIATAAVAVFVAAILFGPAMMTLPGYPISPRIFHWQQGFARRLHRVCLHVARFAIDRKFAVVLFAVVLAGVSWLGIRGTETETSFLNNFRPSSPVVQAYEQVESEFGGAGVWDVVLDAPATIEADYLNEVRQLEAELRAINLSGARLNKVISLADAEAIAATAPLSKMLSPASRLAGMYVVMPVFFDALMSNQNSGQRKLRIMLRSNEQLPSAAKLALIAEVNAVVQRATSTDSWIKSLKTESSDRPVQRGNVTGYYVLMAQLIGQLLRDQWWCFLASGILVWGLLLMATRSISLATVSLLPNLLPVAIVLAVVGVLGGKINMGATMIAAVSVGLSIDGSVHFLAGYQRNRRRGHGERTSALHAAGTIGVPVFLATLALVIGFGVLGTSEFIPTATFGTLVAATLVIGTVVNLTVLPAAVVMAGKTRRGN